MSRFYHAIRFAFPIAGLQSQQLYSNYSSATVKTNINYPSSCVIRPPPPTIAPLPLPPEASIIYKPASFSQRLWAALIDDSCVQAIVASFSLSLQWSIAIQLMYDILSLYYCQGQSIGKKIKGLRTVYAADGSARRPLSWTTCIYLPILYHFCSHSMWWLFLYTYPHDFLSGTTVIDEETVGVD